MSNEIRAMRLRRRSAALRAEPLRVSVLRTAAAIARKLSRGGSRRLHEPTGEAVATNLPNRIAGAFHVPLAMLAIVAIWAGTFIAIGRL